MMRQIEVPIIEMESLAGQYVRLTFENSDFAADCKPGQFLTVLTTTLPTPLLRRPFGVHDVKGDKVRILFKIVGPGTSLLAGYEPGENIDVLGPLGNGFSIPDKPGDFLLVAGGIGIAPIYYLAKSLMQNPGNKVRLFFGGATKADLPTLELFESLDIQIAVTTEDGSYGEKGLVTTPLLLALENGFEHPAQIMACGPPPLLKAVSRIAEKFHTPAQVSLENIMACGVGSCLGCVCEVTECSRDHSKQTSYQRVCAEGPVFDSSAITWKEKR